MSRALWARRRRSASMGALGRAAVRVFSGAIPRRERRLERVARGASSAAAAVYRSVAWLPLGLHLGCTPAAPPLPVGEARRDRPREAASSSLVEPLAAPAEALSAGPSRALPAALPLGLLATPPAPSAAFEHGVIPRFFEVGTDVELASGARADTTAWLRRLLEPPQALHTPFDARLEPLPFVYAEPDPVTRQIKRYAIALPRPRAFSANDRVVAFWAEPALAFDFGVEGSRSFGSLSESGPVPIVHRLKALFEPVGDNAQSYELVYDVEGTDLRLFEHKGLIPGLPVVFERFALYRPDPLDATREPSELSPGAHRIGVRVGLVPTDAARWRTARAVRVGRWRALLATSGDGAQYFLAVDAALRASWYLGNVAADLIVDSSTLAALDTTPPQEARDVTAMAWVLPDATQGQVLSGRLDATEPLSDQLERAAAFLAEHDAAYADLRQHGPRSARFLRHYTRTLLATHRSRREPRALTSLPYADAFRPENARPLPAGVRYGTDYASVLLGLVHYQRQSADPALLDPIAALGAASLAALGSGGAVYEGRFDTLSIGTLRDEQTGKQDAFIDNGAIGASFNHLRLVVHAGPRREPAATWGALSLRIDDRLESIEDGSYAFELDPDSLPRSVRGDQEALGVSRRFTRRDGRLRVRETASLARGVPALRVVEQIENLGAVPIAVGEVRLAVGDFFHYAEGSLEISQNRYGMSRVLDGVPSAVGVWMEGLPEPLWGDAFTPGWVDLSDPYRRSRARFVAVYGYDRAQLYAIPEAVKELWMYNAGAGLPALPGAPGATGEEPSARASTRDGYEGWTTLELRYPAGERLAPGAIHETPPVHAYTLRAPLHSADRDAVPDAIQEFGPIWADAIAGRGSAAALRHLALSPDRASIALHVAWAGVADLLAERARQSADVEAQGELLARARQARAGALRGAEYDLEVLTHLRNRPDLMPTYGEGSHYGFHVLLFEWASRVTRDARYLDAMRYAADTIASGEAQGGLQVTDDSKPNYGGFVQNERERARGPSRLDDQGFKLWALRVAYDRTGEARYLRSAALNIDHWIRIRPGDHLFYGMTKSSERYVPTGPVQQRTPLGHYALMVGLRAWSSLLPRARELYASGLANATTCHPVHGLGTTGPLAGVFPDERIIQATADAELAGLFLLALTWSPEPRGTP